MEKIAKLCVSKGVINDDILNEIKKIFPEKRAKNKFRTYLAVSSPFFNESNIQFDEWCNKPIYTQNHYDCLISCRKIKKEIKKIKIYKYF